MSNIFVQIFAQYTYFRKIKIKEYVKCFRIFEIIAKVYISEKLVICKKNILKLLCSIKVWQSMENVWSS